MVPRSNQAARFRERPFAGPTHSMKNITRCLFCDSRQHAFRFRASDRWYDVEGIYEIYECTRCGLLFIKPQPSAEQIARHYPSAYYALQGEWPDAIRDERLYQIFYGENSSILKKILFLPYRPVLRTFAGGPGMRILDVGCGSGHFLAIAKKLFEMDVYGVEPYPYDVAFATKNDLRIFNGTLEEAAFPNSFFDTITLNHVFEHLPNPRSTLSELRRILRPGGTLVIGVPQSSCMLYWIFGKRWSQLDSPRHLFVPCSNNLRSVAKSMGFRVKRVRYNSTPWSILTTFYYWRNDIARRKRFLHEFKMSRLAFRVLLPFAYLLNLLRIGDQIEILLTLD